MWKSGRKIIALFVIHQNYKNTSENDIKLMPGEDKWNHKVIL